MEDITDIPLDFENLEKYAPSLSKMGKENCFAVSEKYFDELPSTIQSRIFLKDINKNNPFVIPESYFENLSKHIDQTVFLTDLKKEGALKVPEKYFDDLSKRIEYTIFLESIKKEGELNVPEGYFNTLPSIIQNRISAGEKKEIKIIPIREGTRKRYAYVAIAASIALIIGLSTLLKKPEAKLAGKEISIALNGNDKEYIIEHPEMYNIDEILLAEQVSEAGMTELSLQGLDKNDVLNYLSNESGSDLNSVEEL